VRAAPPLAPADPVRRGSTLTARAAVRLFEAQVLSRCLDVAARRLKAEGAGYYTIASAGHETNACVGALVRATDPAFLHYRSGAFMMARAFQVPGTTPVFDTLLSLCAAADDPIAQGRHKVWGSRPLWVPPQTSTIASHLPKAVGCAFALGRARRLNVDPGVPGSAIVCCSFGDASTNHATALAGINAARYAHRRGNPLPILFVCEDNGIGISVDTPRRWLRDAFGDLAHLRYVEADGEIDQVHDAVAHAVGLCRGHRAPVFLHLRCLRLWGHAGSDIETAYRTVAEIEAIEARDPLLRAARRLVETGAADPATLRAIVADARGRVAAAAREAATRPPLQTRAEVMAPLAPYDEARCRAEAEGGPDAEARRDVWGDAPPERATAPTKRTLAAHVNAALADEMAHRPEVVVFGEDVGKKGGVYYVTAGLQRRFGVARVFDTLLDETTILGVAQGAAHVGLLPVPEIQYLAYVHNALDQLRGEAASLSFFSNGQFANPMVVRIAGFAYQRGFGGHFHNDNSIGALRDIPGLILAAPARGDDAARMLRGCLAMARACGRVCCFLEPIALYHEKDLFEEGDGRSLTDYPPPGEALLPGEPGLYRAGSDGADRGGKLHDGDASGDVLVVTYANGVRLGLRAARRAKRPESIAVLDLRWLAPLPCLAVRAAAKGKRRVVVVDECRATAGGVADAVVADLAEHGFRGELRTVRAADSFVPLGPSADAVLVTEEQVAEALA